MSVVAEITVPADTFMLGRMLEDFPDIRIELERIVPVQERIVPLFWMSGADPETIGTKLRESERIETVSRFTSIDDKTLFEIGWGGEINGVVRALNEAHAIVLEATGTSDHWDFRLRFPSREDLSEFNMALMENNITVTLRYLANPKEPAEDSQLSHDQRETLLTAYQHGYFEVPRRTTLNELSEQMDVTDSALSQHLRRATSHLIEQTLLMDEQ